MENLNDKLNHELSIAMKYNDGLYIQRVIDIVLDFYCPNRQYNFKATNLVLYDALVKYNQIKGLHKNARV